MAICYLQRNNSLVFATVPSYGPKPPRIASRAASLDDIRVVAISIIAVLAVVTGYAYGCARRWIAYAIAHRSHNRRSTDRITDADAIALRPAPGEMELLWRGVANAAEYIERLEQKVDLITETMAEMVKAAGMDEEPAPVRHLSLVPDESRNDSAPSRGTDPQPVAEPARKRSAAKRDPAAPFGRDEDGSPIAKYGYKKDGSIRLTKPRVSKVLSKPEAKPEQDAGTGSTVPAGSTLPPGSTVPLPPENASSAEVQPTAPQDVGVQPTAPLPSHERSVMRSVRPLWRSLVNFLLRIPRRRAARRARLAESMRRHPSARAA